MKLKQKKTKKNENAITLIVLVVTIVVLLILAGVSLSLLFSNNGIITKVQESRLETRAATLQDERDLWMNDRYLSKVTGETPKSMVEILLELQNKGTLTVEEVEKIKNDTNNSITIGNKTISFKVVEDTDLSKLKIGDYVNYIYDTVTTDYLLQNIYSGCTDLTVSQTTGLKWRILNINDDGSVELISATPTNGRVELKGALGYNNGVYLINDICDKQYSNKSIGAIARNLTIEDIEAKMNDAGVVAKNSYNNGTATYGDIKTYTGSNSYYPNLYAQENGSGINTTTVKTDGIRRSDKYYSVPTIETYSQASASGLTVTQCYYTNIQSSYFDDNNFYSMIFRPSKEYWLSSRCSCCYTNWASIGLYYMKSGSGLERDQLFYTNIPQTISSKHYLRPVVLLIPNTIDTSLGKDESGAWQIRTK